MASPETTNDLIRLATAEAATAHAEAVEPLHLLIAVCRSESPQVNQAFEVHGVDQVRFRRRVRGFARQVARSAAEGPNRVSARVQRLLELAQREAGALHRPFDAVCVFVALLKSPDAHVAHVLEIEQIPSGEIVQYFHRMLTRIDSGVPTQPEVEVAPVAPRTATPVLDVYGKDYTALARAGVLDPVIGRKEEIKQVVRVLLRKQKNNPVLVGDAGVGKTRIVEGLAIRAAASDAPEPVCRMRVVEIQLSTLVSGAQYRGDLEERLNRIVEEAESDPNVVLFLDELHALVGAGAPRGGPDASAVLKPALARGRIRCIGATTAAEYRRHVEQDPALDRRFQPIPVEEPTPAQAAEVLEGLRASYQQYHGVEITEEAIAAAIDLSVRYVPDRRLPDKACDLIDQAAASKRFKTFSPSSHEPPEEAIVTRDDVARVVAEWTGLPVERLSEGEQDRLLRMEDVLRRRVVGQEVAVRTVARVVRTGMAGLAHPGRPQGVMLFLGPSGVGKTEMAKALAEALFDDPRRLVRADARDALVEAVRRAPQCVVLFDEIERAGPSVMELLAEILDHGQLADAHGQTADFRNTLVVLTSALGSEPCSADPAPEPRDEDSESPDELRRELLEHFRPELLNRINRIVPFRTLALADVHAIVDRLVDRVREERLRDLGVELRMTPGAYEALVGQGFRPACGVRDMERAVEEQIVEPLAQALLDGRLKAGDVVEVVAQGNELKLTSPGSARNRER